LRVGFHQMIRDGLCRLYVISYAQESKDEIYFKIRLSIGILGVVISCNPRIVHQEMNTLLLFGLDLLDESLDIFLLADITW
jgi:hypothetical protein